MGIFKQITLSAVAYSLVCICVTADTNNVQPRTVSPADPAIFVHAFTRFSFPESVGEFLRVKIEKYGPEGKDVGVGYNSLIPIAATVFIYPAEKELLTRHFEACKQDVFHAHADAKLTSENPYTLVQGSQRFEGKKAVFTMRYTFGFASKDSISELYVFLIEPGAGFVLTERYFVTYRITYPSNKKPQAESEIKTFMANLVWPTK